MLSVREGAGNKVFRSHCRHHYCYHYYFQVVSPDSLVLPSSGTSWSLPWMNELQNPSCSPAFSQPILIHALLCHLKGPTDFLKKKKNLPSILLILFVCFSTGICEGNRNILYTFIYLGLGIELKFKSLLNKKNE